MSINISPTEIVRLYRVWTSIIYRCHKPENKQYKNYGERGITVCNEWHDFDKFCEDVCLGSKKGKHLDRIDNNKGYFKENCRWVSPKTNHRNKRNNKVYQTHLGEMCQAEFIEHIGYTRRQFQRAVEKYGIEKFIDLFSKNQLPAKRITSNLQDIIGTKIGNLTILELDPNSAVGARYFCLCDCEKKTRISRFKLLNGLATYCKSCSKRGDRNPNRKKKD